MNLRPVSRKNVNELVPGDVLDCGIFHHYEVDPHPAGRGGWICLGDGSRIAHSAGYPVDVLDDPHWMGCPECARLEGWTTNDLVLCNENDLPQRVVLSRRVVGRQDPTETYTLTCGHSVI